MKVFVVNPDPYFFFSKSQFKGALHDLRGSLPGYDRQHPEEATMTSTREKISQNTVRLVITDGCFHPTPLHSSPTFTHNYMLLHKDGVKVLNERHLESECFCILMPP